jgi:hypothetical protein
MLYQYLAGLDNSSILRQSNYKIFAPGAILPGISFASQVIETGEEQEFNTKAGQSDRIWPE